MKNRFIILLLISTLLLRCVTVVHGTQVLFCPGMISSHAGLDDKPLLLSRGRSFFIFERKLKAQSTNDPCEYDIQAASNESHPLRHSVPTPGMHMSLLSYNVHRLLSIKLIVVKTNLLPTESGTPNNKGSPKFTATLTRIVFYFENYKYPTNDPYFYISLPSTPIGSCVHTVMQLHLRKKHLFIVSGNLNLPGAEEWANTVHNLPASFALTFVASAVSCGPLFSILYLHREADTALLERFIHSPP